MPNHFLLIIVKGADFLIDKEFLIQFLITYYRMKNHYLTILVCLQSRISSNENATSKIKQKATLKDIQVSKKVKYLNDLVATEIIRITVIRNQGLIKRRKANRETKTRIKKVAKAIKK